MHVLMGYHLIEMDIIYLFFISIEQNKKFKNINLLIKMLYNK